MRIITTTFTIILALLLVTLQAQNSVEYVPPTPEEAALIKQIDIANNYSTGSANVNIPLYTIKGDKISHPISMSYSSNGVKVEQEASRLGQDWRLVAGGTVTRITRGLPDEHLSTIGIPDDTQGGSGQNVVISGILYEDQCEDNIYYSCDMLSDLFYYTIPGGPSGSFTLNKDGTVFQMPYNNVEITYELQDDGTPTDRTNDPDMLTSFTVKDENGMTYEFDKFILTANDKFTTYSHSNFFGYWKTDFFTSSWQITKISEISTGEEITFEYESTGNFEYGRPLNYYDNATSPPGFQCECPYIMDDLETGYQNMAFSSANNILKKIVWRYGEVRFTHESRTDLPGDKRFSKMEVYDKDLNGNLNRRSGYDFIQSYFQASNTSEPLSERNRLRLDGLQQLNSAGIAASIPAYSFDYFGPVLPTKSSMAKDLWGYYNGKPSTKGIPEIWFYYNDNSSEAIQSIKRPNSDPFYHISGADRKSDINFAKAGMLKEVEYPTGATHTFDYELHNFKYNNLTYTGGGLRLKSHEIDDNNSNSFTTLFEYKESNNTTSGYAVSLPHFAHMCYDVPSLSYTNVSNALFRASKSFKENVGAQITYSRVKESVASNGYNIHEFTSAKDYPDEEPIILESPAGIGEYDKSPFLQCTSFDYKRGLPTSFSQYDQSNNLVAQTNSVFDFVHQDSFLLEMYRPYNVELASSGCFIRAKRKINEEYVQKISEQTLLDGYGKTMEYLYNDENKVWYEYFRYGENNDLHLTIYRYPYEFNTGENPTLNTQRRWFPVEIKKYQNGVQNDGSKSTYSQFSGSGPFLSKSERYEVSWDANGTIIDNGWQDAKHFTAYNTTTGKPTAYNDDKWNSYYLTWNALSQLTKMKFNSYEWNFTYHPTLRLLASKENIDDVVTSFTFDDYQRLKTVTDQCRGDVLTYTYSISKIPKATHVTAHQLYAKLGNHTNIGLTTRSYKDGLGREILNMRIGQSPISGESIEYHTLYDALGRKSKVYEPKSSNTILYTPPSGDFTLYQYQPNLLGRVVSVLPPSWHATTYSYRTNTTSEANGYSSAGLLHVTTTTDPNGNKTLTYNDQKGREVLMRKQNAAGSTSHDTYTHWDAKDRKTTVLPPNTTISDDNMIYKYLYYPNDLLQLRDLPDSNPISYVYNERDLLAYTQDGNMDDDNRWYAIEYDVYGNNTFEGWYNGSPSANGSFSQATINGTTFKNTIYDLSGPGKGQPYIKVANFLMTSDNHVSTFLYDACSRPREISNSIFDQTAANIRVNSSFPEYDSRDEIYETVHRFKDDFGTEHKIITHRNYDLVGRQISESIQYSDSGPILPLYSKTFTPKEQIASTTLGSNTPLVNMEYDYLPNGFLKSMTDPLYTQELYYDTPYDGNATARMNGDISSVMWKAKGRDSKVYHYDYDFKDQIKKADYFNITTPSKNGDYNSTYGYDARGNIMNITRDGPTTTKSKNNHMDDLTFSITPGTNQLASVREQGDRFSGYKGGISKSIVAYTYDANGNITTDPDRGITMTMNHLNKVNRITKDANNYIDYYYDANGLLHRKKIVENGSVLETRDYLRGVELKDGVVDMIHFSEGFLKYRNGNAYQANLVLSNPQPVDALHLAGTITSTSDIHNQSDVSYVAESSITMNSGFEVDNNTKFTAVINPNAQLFEDWEVFYSIKDHLGNTRVVFSDVNLDGGIDTSEMLQVSSYYSFGAEHSTSKTGEYAYRYNGKEKELGLDIGLLRFEARDMDPWTGRFRGVDPISDQFPHVSPYNYAENSPIANIDLHGLQKVNVIDVRNSAGKITSRNAYVHVDMKVLNYSTRENFQFNANLSKAESKASHIFSAAFSAQVHDVQNGNRLTENNVPINVEFTLDTKQVSSFDQISETDFVSIVSDDISQEASEWDVTAGWGEIPGNLSILSASSFSLKGGDKLLLHELGHNLDLDFNGNKHSTTGLMSGGKGTSIPKHVLQIMYSISNSVLGNSYHKKHVNSERRINDFYIQNSK